ncbi:ABC transporter substrate-binding protein [Enterocloster lavalensis]|uniref:ABC transporter substrate-binding protein n=1 Tax=Enterocloster lavalensis TaxID=460384 RepID=UPI0023F3E268|nr:extracellular solute-binding protein [Enterocloster lavalensis]
MKKTWLWRALACAGAMTLLTGCGAKTGEPPETAAQTQAGQAQTGQSGAGTTEEGGAGELTGKLVIMTNASGGTFEAMNEVFARFMEENPGVEIEYSSQGKDYEQLMKAKMAANDLPDLFATHGWSVNRYSEYLRPLNDQEWYGDLVEEILPVMSDSEGQIYALPMNVDKSGIVYNADLLEKLGKEVPKTWDEFLDACEEAKNQGYTPVYLAGKDPGKLAGVINTVSPTYLITDEADNYRAELKDGSFDWANYAPVFQLITKLRDSGYLNKDYQTADPITIPQKLAGGEVLFALENNATMADAYALKEDAGLAMMPVPTASPEDEPVLLGGEREAYGVWKDGPNQELALELLRFMAEKENIEKVSTASGMPASMKGATGNLGVVNESYEKYADSRVFPKFDREYLPNGMWSTMKTVGSALIAGDVDVDKACQMMGEDYIKFREQNNE